MEETPKPDEKPTPGLGGALFVCALYSGALAASTALIFRTTEGPAPLEAIIWPLLAAQVLATGFCVYVARQYYGWAGAGFGRLNLTGLVWLLPATLNLVLMVWEIARAWSASPSAPFAPGLLLGLIGVTALVGLGEELLFRGILLRSALRAIPVLAAMLLSALLFGGFHLINLLAGQGAGTTSAQVVFAFFVGLAMAPIALRLGNLWPLILWHWFWNLAVIISQMLDVLNPMILAGMMIQVLVSVWLWVSISRSPGLYVAGSP